MERWSRQTTLNHSSAPKKESLKRSKFQPSSVNCFYLADEVPRFHYKRISFYLPVEVTPENPESLSL
jgi:hypothetical protein